MRAFAQCKRTANNSAFLYDTISAQVDGTGFRIEYRGADVNTLFEKYIFGSVNNSVLVAEGGRLPAGGDHFEVESKLGSIFLKDFPGLIDDRKLSGINK